MRLLLAPLILSLASCASGPAARDLAGFLATEEDRKGARALLDYYFAQILRSPEKKAQLCGVKPSSRRRPGSMNTAE